jgi:hypothetical protein
MSILGVEGTTVPSAADGFLNLKNVSDVDIRGNTAPEATNVYAMVSGPSCSGIVFSKNDLQRARKSVQIAADVPKGAVRIDTKVQRPG